MNVLYVNHTGEVCAQALYAAQEWKTKNPLAYRAVVNAFEKV